jgi:hypothetical protein
MTPSLLAYRAGGFAYGGANVDTTLTSTTNRLGGRRPALNLVASSWSVKAEYLYFDLGTLKQTHGDNAGRPHGVHQHRIQGERAHRRQLQVPTST